MHKTDPCKFITWFKNGLLLHKHRIKKVLPVVSCGSPRSQHRCLPAKARGPPDEGQVAGSGSGCCTPPLSCNTYNISTWHHIKAKEKEEHMLKQSIFAILTGLLWSHLPYIINQPLQTFGVLQATLKHNECTRSNLPLALWPWVKVKVVQTGRVVAPNIIPSLKQISSHVPGCWPTLKVYFIKSHSEIDLASALTNQHVMAASKFSWTQPRNLR